MCNFNLTVAQKAKLTKANRLIASVLEESGLSYAAGLGVCSPDQVFSYMRSLIGFEDKEVFAVMFLDNQNRLIQGKVMFSGTINETSVYPREIVKEALLCNAATIIISHNHPSGELKPSEADLRMTKKIQDACRLVEIRVLDHLIVSAVDYYSLLENFQMSTED